MVSQGHSLYDKFRPFIAVVFLQVGLAGMDVLCKSALNKGMSNYVLVVYRHVVATVVMFPFAAIIDKKIRPKMTLAIFIKIAMLGLLEPVIDQNLYYLGMKYTTATFAAAMYNILPAITFLMAYIIRLEKVNIRCLRSQAKVFGTIATVAGAMVMTLVKGPVIDLIWTRGRTYHGDASSDINLHNSIKGAIMITIGCFSWACFIILQAVTLQTYPAELSLTVWICLMGTIEGTAVALVMERGNSAVWAINWDTKLLAAVYSGIITSGLAYYIQGIVMKERGPVFLTAFSPLAMIIVAVMSSFILAEQMYLGRVIGATVVVAGLYLVVWGKGKDYKTPDLTMDKQIAPVDANNNGKENSNHEIITIDGLGRENVDSDKQKYDKNNPISA